MVDDYWKNCILILLYVMGKSSVASRETRPTYVVVLESINAIGSNQCSYHGYRDDDSIRSRDEFRTI